MKEVVRKEVLKWLDAGVIYLFSDSSWVSPVQVIPKKGGTTVIRTENNALLPSQTVTGWRICIDYRKLNKATISWTGIRVIIISLYPRRTKRKQHLRARMVRLLLGECPLGYVTNRAHFSVA